MSSIHVIHVCNDDNTLRLNNNLIILINHYQKKKKVSPFNEEKLLACHVLLVAGSQVSSDATEICDSTY